MIEYGLGRRRADLLVIWPWPGGKQQVVIELKLLYKLLKETIEQGVEQTWAYMDRSGTDVGNLVIFDRSEKRSWEEKLFIREETYQDKVIKVWGM